MVLISLPAANQPTLPCTFVVPALSLVPLLALVIFAMKRKRLPPTTDAEAQRSFEEDDPLFVFEGADEVSQARPAKVPRKQSPPRMIQRSRKAIPKRMKHMAPGMTIWGDRWLPSIAPSTTGSQQGEIDPSGAYTPSRSPPPSYRTTPLSLSPVVMESSSSSPNPHTLSSDFKLVDNSPPPRPISPPFEGMFLFGDTFGSDFADSFGQFSTSDRDRSFSPFPDPCAFDFSSEVTLPGDAHPNYSAPPFHPHLPSSFTPHPFSNPMAPIEFHSGLPIATVPSNNPHAPYPLPGAKFSDWIPPPTMQHGLPLAPVAPFPNGLPYNSVSYPTPSQNTSSFQAAASWKPNDKVPYHGQFGHTMPMVAGHSTPPMYTGHNSPYLGMPDGQSSPIYHRSSSGSPLTMYSRQPPQYHPHAPPIRTASSGSVASLYSHHSPHAMSRAMSGCSDYSDLEYGYSSGYSSPHSAVFTGSPGSASSAYGGHEGGYPGTTNSATRIIPLPFHNPQHPNWLF
ncbi:hypothetical protein DFH09DRAFT_93049 [Mycena vulgaris]|nr:hypothetical protein DFH09DRAFT_93049 [Mycena vulgaris]